MLPAPRDRFWGREGELERLAAQLDEAHAVTLVGPPGIGKTRAAIEYTRRFADHYDRVGFVPLANAFELGPAVAAIGAAFEIELPPVAGEAMPTAIASWIREQGRMLVVLDNFEQIVATSTALVDAIVRHAPEAHVLVTSRHRLRTAGEWVLEIGALPDDGAFGLLVDRVQRLRGSYAPKPAEQQLLHAIADELEGVPLALELAAIRISTLGAAAVLDRLDEKLEFLTVGLRGDDLERSSLKEAVERSWRLLDDGERAVLAACSVFRGGFDLAAATEVLEDPRVVDALHDLCEKSLLDAHPDDDGQTRFFAYESIREFGAAQLDPEHRAALERRHADYYVRRGEALERLQHTPEADARAGLDELAAERENLLAIAGRGLTERPSVGPEYGVRALLCLVSLVVARGPIDALVERLDRALDQFELDPHLKVRALLGAARGHRRLGRGESARRHQSAALELVEQLGDETLRAQTKSDLAMTLMSEGAFEAAPPLLAEALEARRRSDDVAGSVLDRTRMGMALRELGRLDEADPHLAAALAYADAGGAHVAAAITIGEIAHVALDRGDCEAARRVLLRAPVLTGPREDGSASALAEAAVAARVGMLAHTEGDLVRAEAYLQAALIGLRRVGYRRFEAGVSAYLGIVDLERGALDSAAKRITASYEAVRDEPRARDFMLGWLAVIDLRRGEFESARRRRAMISSLDESDPLSVAAHRLAILSAGDVPEAGGATSHEVRLVERVARGLLNDAGAEPTSSTPMFVAASGDWFAAPTGERGDLKNKRALRAILLKLVEGRLLSPAVPVPRDALIEVGWPDEQILADAAKNRVKTAISSLRKQGIGTALRHEKGGYLLDAGLPVVVISE